MLPVNNFWVMIIMIKSPDRSLIKSYQHLPSKARPIRKCRNRLKFRYLTGAPKYPIITYKISKNLNDLRWVLSFKGELE